MFNSILSSPEEIYSPSLSPHWTDSNFHIWDRRNVSVDGCAGWSCASAYVYLEVLRAGEWEWD